MSLRVEELVNIIVGSEKSNLEGLQEGIQPGIKRRYDERNRGDEGNHTEREKKRQLGREWQHGGSGYDEELVMVGGSREFEGEGCSCRGEYG